MIKVIKGKGTPSGYYSGEFTIKGREACTPSALSHITPLIKSLGFMKVTSHSDCLDIGCGDNTLAMYNKSASTIASRLEIPTSVIAITPSFSGPQADNALATNLKNCAASGCTVTNYTNDKGAVIVSGSGRVIGHYDTKLNLLVLTDLTHNQSAVEKLTDVLKGVQSYREHFNIIGSVKKTKKDKSLVLLFPKIDKKLMIGLDPELAILDKRDQFKSCTFAPGGGDQEVGSDCGNVEIRPKPGTPKQLVKTVEELYTKIDKILDKEHRLLSGGGSFVSRTLGGHIHFNIPIHKELTVLLDDFIGKPMKRMNGTDRLKGSGYGGLGSVKVQPHGFEYRTPPSFVGKPDLFAGVIALAYCIASTWRTISNRGITFEYGCGGTTGAYRSTYEKLTYYKTYAKEIEDFLSYVYDEEKTIEEHDVLAAWQVRDAIILEDVII